jgi:hypothetical protein
LYVTWKKPPSLQADWVPFHLRFHTDDEPGTLDPDEQMFGLLDLFLARRDEFVRQLRAVAGEATAHLGPVVEARVEVHREGGGGGPGVVEYSLLVYLRFEGNDGEHSHFSRYHPDTQRFESLQ